MQTQIFVFSVSLFCGVLLGVMFDFFRAFRRKFIFGNTAVGVQDTMFWIFSVFIAFLLIRYANGGELRWYIFFALFSGAFLYNATISSMVIRLLVCFISLLGVFIKFAVKIILFPLTVTLRLLKKPFFFVCLPMRKFTRFLKQGIQKRFKSAKKLKKRLKLY